LNGTNISAATNASWSSSKLSSGDVVACSMTSGFSCALPPTAASNAITIAYTVPQTPILTMMHDTISTNIYALGDVYQWTYNDTLVWTSVNNYFVCIGRGKYSVVINSANSCNDTSGTTFFDNEASVEEYTALNSIEVSPNPFSEEILIVLKKEGHFRVRVYDRSGRVVKDEENTSGIMNIDTHALDKGMYILRIDDGEKNYAAKLMKV
jgi:hypothetical protein